MTDLLTVGRDALGRHAWTEALDAFTGADREHELSPDDLQLLAQAAWWSGRPDDAVEAWERAFAGHNAAGNRSAAAWVALRLAELAFRRVSYSIAGGWLARAERLLESEPESAVHAWVEFMYAADALFHRKDWDAVIEHADKAIDLGRRHGSSDVQSIALSFKGQALVRKGNWAEGLALFDEATAAAISGELDPKTACDIYCNTIAACRSLADYQRSGEWTEEADRWMARHDIRGYRGACRLHRAELKRLRGSWAEAEQEVRRACEELEEFRLLDVVGDAHYELGELHLHMGDLEGAEESFRRAYEYGRDPQPGMALLLLARGEAEAAARAIAQSLHGGGSAGDSSYDRVERTRLLPAQVEIALSRSDLSTARRAVEELETIVAEYQSPALDAASLSARGSLELAEGNTEEAITLLGRAWRRWQEIDLPYEGARARLLLGQARLEAGDESNALLDIQSSRSVFERLGARLDLARVDEALEPRGVPTGPDRHRVDMTFMFTDIVVSTDLLDLIGDEAWDELLGWHDRTLRSAFALHGGEEVSHTGDGFFVSFAEPAGAVGCAVEIQRQLASHRRDHGFAPWVRVGIHTAEATRRGSDYAGKGVHVAARVGALADREQILITRDVLEAAGSVPFPLSDSRPVTLKGVKEPVDVFEVAWR